MKYDTRVSRGFDWALINALLFFNQHLKIIMVISSLQRRFFRRLDLQTTYSFLDFNIFLDWSRTTSLLRKLIGLNFIRVKAQYTLKLVSPLEQDTYTRIQNLSFKLLTLPKKFACFLFKNLIAHIFAVVNFIVLEYSLSRLKTILKKTSYPMFCVFFASCRTEVIFVLIWIYHKLELCFCVFVPLSHHHQTVI